MEIKRRDLIGMRFGRLLVLRESFDKKAIAWVCLCDCGNEKVIVSSSLVGGLTQSCGCLKRERISETHLKRNRYDLSGEFGIGLTSKDEEFYFSLCDYDLIKIYSWRVNNGYIESNNYIGDGKSQRISLHRFIMNLKKEDKMFVDHINRNRKDCRRENMRLAASKDNRRNVSLRKKNKTGITGVQDMGDGKWKVRIHVDGKNIQLLLFYNFYDAVKARLELEKKYFGEFAPQRHLFKEYGIEE